MTLETTLLELGYTRHPGAGDLTLISPDADKMVTVSPSPNHYAVTVLVTREHFAGRPWAATETRAIETNTFSGREALKLLGA